VYFTVALYKHILLELGKLNKQIGQWHYVSKSVSKESKTVELLVRRRQNRRHISVE